MNSKLSSKAILAVASVLALIAAVAIWLVAPETFRDAYLSNLLATLIGVAIAIPIGLGVDRWRQSSEEADRRIRLLVAIRNDLVSIQEDLASRVPRNQQVVVPFLGGGLWEAVSGSGQISDLTNPEQLRAIARAYDRIAVTRYLERQVWELQVATVRPDPTTAPLGVHPPRPRIDIAMAALVDQDRHTDAAIDYAVERIGATS